jgi:glutathionyl-hydroquinone reductase
MGLLVNGQWNTDWYDTKATGGRFERKAPSFRNWVTAGGSAGPSGIAETVELGYIKATAAIVAVVNS